MALFSKCTDHFWEAYNNYENTKTQLAQGNSSIYELEIAEYQLTNSASNVY